MTHGEGGRWKGKSEGDDASLQKALENAWEQAKKGGGSAGKYEVTKIEIDCENPIRTYLVEIQPI